MSRVMKHRRQIGRCAAEYVWTRRPTKRVEAKYTLRHFLHVAVAVAIFPLRVVDDVADIRKDFLQARTQSSAVRIALPSSNVTRRAKNKTSQHT